MTTELLHAAIRQAINDADGAQGPDDMLTLQATAAVRVVEELGYFEKAGDEYAVRRGDVVEELGFNTEEQARAWASNNLPRGITYEIQHRPVGVWEQ